MRPSLLRGCAVLALLLPAWRAGAQPALPAAVASAPPPTPRTAPVSPLMPKQGQPFKIPNLGLDMMPIAAGTFMMGSPAGEPGHAANESPQTRVTISRAFWLGKYEVTQAEWQAVMRANPGAFKDAGPRTPVESVSWNDAVEFCAKLTERERAAGRVPADCEYRLPTEAEWEYACRAGSTGAYAGNVAEMAWFLGNSDGTPHPVGQKRANEWALFDLHGNVAEWCLDWYLGSLPTTSYTDPTGPEQGTLRVSRGGAWDVGAASGRSAARAGHNPADRRRDLGLRVALARKLALIETVQLADPLAKPDASGEMLDKKPPVFGQRAILPGLGLELAPVPAGTFMMGSPATEPERSTYEGPQTRVTLTKPFWLGKYEVTQAEWQTLMGDNPSTIKNETLRAPVENVTWTQAGEFCRRLTERERAANRLPTGYAYRLPTEAEWEYACRAGTSGAYAGTLANLGWTGGNSGSRTHPVGQKQPNAWGLYDMHGNVAEWCLDWMAATTVIDAAGYTGPGTLKGLSGGSLTNPTGPGRGTQRIYRGGSWQSSPALSRAASRAWAVPTQGGAVIGLRVALAPQISP